MSQTENPKTELRVIITEDQDGNLDIKYQAYVAGSEVLIAMRPAHIAGKLYAGAMLVLAEKYKLLGDKSESKVTRTEGKKHHAK